MPLEKDTLDLRNKGWKNGRIILIFQKVIILLCDGISI
jgi:hypothetical protein